MSLSAVPMSLQSSIGSVSINFITLSISSQSPIISVYQLYKTILPILYNFCLNQLYKTFPILPISYNICLYQLYSITLSISSKSSILKFYLNCIQLSTSSLSPIIYVSIKCIQLSVSSLSHIISICLPSPFFLPSNSLSYLILTNSHLTPFPFCSCLPSI